MNPTHSRQTIRTFHIVKEAVPAESEAVSRREAIESRNTQGVAAGAACGLAVHDFTRVIEQTGEGSQSVTTWAIEEGFVEFHPEFRAEKISTGELLRRMRDTEWLRAHEHHPIAYMAAALQANKQLGQAIRAKKPLIAFRRGKHTAFLVPQGNPTHGRAMLERAGFTEAEIEQILPQIYGQA